MITKRNHLPPKWVDPVALMVLGAAIRFYKLTTQSLWEDELFTAFWSRQSPGFLAGRGAHIETIPPTYYLLMHGWTNLFGNSPLSIRLLPLIFSTASIAVIYAAAVVLFDRKTALIAALFAAINPFSVMYGQEARPYAILEFLNGLCFLAMAVWLRRGEGITYRQRGYLALFTIAAIAGIYLQYAELFFVFSCFLVIGLAFALERPWRVREVLEWTGAGIVIAIFAIWPMLLAVNMSGSPDIDWIPRVSLQSLGVFFSSVLIYPRIFSQNFHYINILILGLVVVLAICAPRMKLRGNQLFLLVVLPLCYMAVIILVSLDIPMLLARIAVWLAIPICIIYARAAAAQNAIWKQGAVTLIVCAIWAFSLQHYFRFSWKEDWKSPAYVVAHDPQCSGPLAFGLLYGVGLFYYQPQLAKRPMFGTPIYESSDGLLTVPAGNTSGEVLEKLAVDAPIVPLSEFPQLISRYPHLAIVLPWSWGEILKNFRPPVAQWTFRGGIHVACY